MATPTATAVALIVPLVSDSAHNTTAVLYIDSFKTIHKRGDLCAYIFLFVWLLRLSRAFEWQKQRGNKYAHCNIYHIQT